jgi:hypothetical protein
LTGFAVAAGPGDEPAQIPGFELPCRTVFQAAAGALVDIPAFFLIVFSIQRSIKQKQSLSFHMVGDFAPPLFITVNRFDGNSQQLGQFFLGFAKPVSQVFELVRIHEHPFMIHTDWNLSFY